VNPTIIVFDLFTLVEIDEEELSDCDEGDEGDN
jgi:hypothetical protein